MRIRLLALAVLLLLLCGCVAQTNGPADDRAASARTESEAPAMAAREEPPRTDAAETVGEAETTEENAAGTGGEEDTMRLWIDGTEVPVTWENNASVAALGKLCPVTVEMSMYGAFEQVGSIGQSIVREDAQTDAAAGDLVLYAGNQIVIFYAPHSWAYTRLGHVDLTPQEMVELLGRGDVTITLK